METIPDLVRKIFCQESHISVYIAHTLLPYLHVAAETVITRTSSPRLKDGGVDKDTRSHYETQKSWRHRLLPLQATLTPQSSDQDREQKPDPLVMTPWRGQPMNEVKHVKECDYDDRSGMVGVGRGSRGFDSR